MEGGLSNGPPFAAPQACPCLISEFVDPGDEFLYVSADKVMAVAEREGAIPFDIRDVERRHVDGRCSVESIIVEYDLKDQGLQPLAQIVHGADIPADLESCLEATGLFAIANGFALIHRDGDQRSSASRRRCSAL